MKNVRNKQFNVLLALGVVVALILSIVAILTTTPKQKETWKCVRATCAEFYTQEEWISNNCYLNASNKFICRVVFNNQQVEVPLEKLNLSTLRECKVYRCLEEIRVRPVNYTFTLNTTRR